MAFTQAQQDRIDTATEKVTLAKNAYDAVLSELNSRYTVADSAHTSLWQCKGFNGTTKNWEAYNEDTCQSTGSQFPGCNSKAICKDRVKIWNNAFASWSGYQGVVDGKLKAWNDAKQALNDVLEAIKIEVANDPALQAELAEIQANAMQEGMTQRTKYWIWGIIVVVVIVAGIFLYIRFIRK